MALKFLLKLVYPCKIPFVAVIYTSLILLFTQEEPPILIEKRLELNNIQQKVENLRSSLDCFRNIEGGISCDSVMERPEEQLKMINQCRFIHQQAGVLVYD